MEWQEKRKYKRAYIKLPVECRGKTYWQYIEARDISAGGMFVVTDKVEPPSTKVEIMFELGEEKDKRFILAEGVVAWNRPNPIMDETGKVQSAGMGIMFTKLTPLPAKQFIEQLVKRMEDKGA
jgi:Tfp pilus assembly protein PilZ